MNPTPQNSNAQRILVWLWYWLPPLLVMAAIFYVSHQPDLPRAPDPWLDVLLKKLAHATEYAILFLFLLRAWRRDRAADQALKTAVLTTAAYAISDELHQAFVPGRKANWYDVVIDVSGVLLLWWLLRNGPLGRVLHGKDKDLAE
jgi:VanZ family protein